MTTFKSMKPISDKTLWTKYQTALRCYMFDSLPLNHVEIENYDTKCCLQNKQYCLGWEKGGICFI